MGTDEVLRREGGYAWQHSAMDQPLFDVPRPAFPAQDPAVAWPTQDWPTGEPPAGVDLTAFLDEVFDEQGPCATTNAVVVVHRGRLVAERYAGQREFFDREPEPVDASSQLVSWSTAKSMVQAIACQLVEEGSLALDEPPGVAGWEAGDPRAAITLRQMLQMRDGLEWTEVYEVGEVSHVIEMLFGEGKDDVAAYVASRPLAHEPGSTYNYSSGTTNLISAAIADRVGRGEAYEAAIHERLFGPLGMASAYPTLDPAGVFIGSSYVHATARDFAKFGMLYLRGGSWEGQQLVPEWAVELARTPVSYDPDNDHCYSHQWWIPNGRHGTFTALGFEGQSIDVCPALDLVVVRLGRTDDEGRPALASWRLRLVDAFADALA